MSDNVKFISEIERLLKQKQNDYGHFDHTSYVMVGIMEKYLSIHNNQDVKIPLKFFGLFMIFLKCWRVMQSENYKKDSFDDINGYTELLRRLVIDENKTTKRPMTPKMLKLLQFIKNYIKKYKYSPTFSEMAKELGYKSKN